MRNDVVVFGIPPRTVLMRVAVTIALTALLTLLTAFALGGDYDYAQILVGTLATASPALMVHLRAMRNWMRATQFVKSLDGQFVCMPGHLEFFKSFGSGKTRFLQG